MASINEKAISSDGNAVSVSSKVEQGSVENGEVVVAALTPEEEKKLVKKIDFHLIPLMFVLYFFQYIDKTSLGYTAIMGIKTDTNLQGQEYSWVSSFFYVGFLVASPLASIFLVKFPAGKVVSITVLIWGMMLMCMGAAKNFGGLSVLRLLLGAMESAINPAFTILTAMWYKPSEHALRHGLWYGGAPVAMTFGGLLSYAINHITAGMAPWKWLFVLFGAATFLWGVVMLIFLPDAPQHAKFLTPDERRQAFARVQGEQHSTYTQKWNNSQLVEALIDPKSWLLFFLGFGLCLPGGGIGTFGSVILQGFGFDTFTTLLLGMSQGGFFFVFVVFTVTVSMKFKNWRCISIAICQLISLAGCLMIQLIPAHNKMGRVAGLWFWMASSASTPTIMSLISSNVGGYTKKAVVSAMFFVGFCAGYIVGPQTFLTREEPEYKTAFNIMLACFAINTVLVIALRQVMAFSNAKRDRDITNSTVSNGDTGDTLADLELDETDWQNKKLRYEL